MVEDKDTQWPNPFKIQITSEHPQSCLTAIASSTMLAIHRNSNKRPPRH